MSNLTILIPAAGASSRMRGADKLLATISGTPLLRRTAQIALAAHPDVLITLRPQDEARRQALDGLPVQILVVEDAANGLSASLRSGAAAINRGLMVLPADMPDITAQDLRTLIAVASQSPDAILRATAFDGTPGHPVLFPADLLPAFAHLTGDEGARSILQAHKSRIKLIALPGAHALTDLDTPEAWETWLQTGH
ncbi:MAG: nucleotidyltransferase family protein [Cypionkella sp.]